jgi:hypothetical protein
MWTLIRRLGHLILPRENVCSTKRIKLHSDSRLKTGQILSCIEINDDEFENACEAKSTNRSSESKLRISRFFFIFNAKLRFALLASLRSANSGEFKVDNLLVTLPAGLKIFF